MYESVRLSLVQLELRGSVVYNGRARCWTAQADHLVSFLLFFRNSGGLHCDKCLCESTGWSRNASLSSNRLLVVMSSYEQLRRSFTFKIVESGLAIQLDLQVKPESVAGTPLPVIISYHGGGTCGAQHNHECMLVLILPQAYSAAAA